MERAIALSDDIYWVGVNDRTTDLFESIWPIPRGVSYNAYCILDDRVAVIDTVKEKSFGAFLEKIRQVAPGRNVDYLVVNHLEPDHSGAIPLLREVFPAMRIVGNPRTVEYLERLYGITRDLVTVNDGETLEIGRHRLAFVTVPMVHWPESMVTYDSTTGTLFSNDAFGGFGALDGGIFDDQVDVPFFEDEILRYFSNIVGKYAAQVQKAFDKLRGVDVRMIAPSHGPIWRKDPGHIMALYDRWSRHEGETGVVLVYGSMYGNCARMMEAVAAGVVEAGISAIRIHDAARVHPSYIIRDAWRYRGLIIGSPTYDAALFPPVGHLVTLLEMKRLRNRVVGVFGNFGWGGMAVKRLREFACQCASEVVEPAVEVQFAPGGETLETCRALGREVARRVLAAAGA